MGLSTFPRTEAQVAALERAMSRPLFADRAEEALSGVLVDDTLLDMVAAVRRADPGGDVRGLVAMALDELVNWSDPGGFRKGGRGRGADWPEPYRDRCGILVWRHRDDDGPLAHSRLGPFDDARAEALVAACLPGGAAEPGRLDVRPGTGPGSRTVVDTSLGTAFRVEGFYGVVMAAPDCLRDDIVERTAAAGAPVP